MPVFAGSMLMKVELAMHLSLRDDVGGGSVVGGIDSATKLANIATQRFTIHNLI
jgi:hypothetical protein